MMKFRLRLRLRWKARGTVEVDVVPLTYWCPCSSWYLCYTLSTQRSQRYLQLKVDSQTVSRLLSCCSLERTRQPMAGRSAGKRTHNRAPEIDFNRYRLDISSPSISDG